MSKLEQLVVLAGANGAGKTRFLRAVMQILHSRRNQVDFLGAQKQVSALKEVIISKNNLSVHDNFFKSMKYLTFYHLA
ncbi:MAG: hypothetical protein IPG70_07240 [Moraxellaceae bacterium]|nr:hypothetical protein [Moraxellaceae bacterium]